MTEPLAPGNAGVVAPPALPDTTPPPPAAGIPKRVTCPICKTSYDPRASAGMCPVCGEQVVPAEMATRAIPVLTATGQWLRAGGWRLVLLVVFVLYEVLLFLGVWHQFSLAHLL